MNGLVPESSAPELLRDDVTFEALVEALMMVETLAVVFAEVFRKPVGLHSSTAPKTMLKDVL